MDPVALAPIVYRRVPTLPPPLGAQGSTPNVTGQPHSDMSTPQATDSDQSGSRSSVASNCTSTSSASSHTSASNSPVYPSDGNSKNLTVPGANAAPGLVPGLPRRPSLRSATPDPRLTIRYLCNPLPSPPEVPRVVHTAVVHHFYQPTLGYSVFFGENDPRNEFDSCGTDKSSHRVELRAILRAMQRLAPLANDVDRQSWTIFTCNESTVRRIAAFAEHDTSRRSEGAERWFENTTTRGQSLNHTQNQTPATSALAATQGPTAVPGGVEEDMSSMSLGTKGTSNLDLLFQIRELRWWLDLHGLRVVVAHVSDSEENARRAVKLAQLGAANQPNNGHYPLAMGRPPLLLDEPTVYDVTPPNEFQRVYTDGSTVQRDGETIAGYGVYFGYFDRRNECAPVLGKGTGPRASLAAILRALVIISRANGGHRRWEIASCRGQYLQSVFELSAQWQKSGWKRNAGKPIANLSIYRESRRILDALEEQGIEVRAVYISQKHNDRGIQFAGMLARRSAGDHGIEIPIKVGDVFEVPKPPGEEEPSILYTEAIYRQTELKGRWKVRFGANPLMEGSQLGGFRDARDQDGVCGSIHQSRERCVMFVLLKGLRLIEQDIERYWIVYCNSTDAVTIVNRYLKRKTGEKPPLYVESVIKHVQRLQKHGYRFEFKVSPHIDAKSELRFDFGDVSSCN